MSPVSHLSVTRHCPSKLRAGPISVDPSGTLARLSPSWASGNALRIETARNSWRTRRHPPAASVLVVLGAGEDGGLSTPRCRVAGRPGRRGEQQQPGFASFCWKNVSWWIRTLTGAHPGPGIGAVPQQRAFGLTRKIGSHARVGRTPAFCPEGRRGSLCTGTSPTRAPGTGPRLPQGHGRPPGRSVVRFVSCVPRV